MSDLRDEVRDLIKAKGLQHRETAFKLSSGDLSHDYIDGKRAIAQGKDLRLVSEALVELAGEKGVRFDAVGGLTLGADAPTHGVAVVADKQWFTVRKAQKDHGKQDLIVGADIEGLDILLVDDVVTTGASIVQALHAIKSAGGNVVLAVCLVDRSGRAEKPLADEGVPFAALLTWEDLGIEPVGRGAVPA